MLAGYFFAFFEEQRNHPLFLFPFDHKKLPESQDFRQLLYAVYDKISARLPEGFPV